MGVEFEEDAEQRATDQLAGQMAPPILGQISLVGGRLIGMSTTGNTHTMIFDNGITAEIDGVFRLRRTSVKDLGGGDPAELSAAAIQEHFKQLEPPGE